MRLDLLELTLKSVWEQVIPIIPCVIVHADIAAFAVLQRWVEQFGKSSVLLRAEKHGYFSGHLYNIGLEYALSHAESYDFLCMLKEGDAFYPFFSDGLCAALNLTASDISCGMANIRFFTGELKAGHTLLPWNSLVAGNPFSLGSLAIRISFLKEAGIHFREDLRHLEDWDFLLSALAAGARFQPVFETVSETCVFDDNNGEPVPGTDTLEACHNQVEKRGIEVARQIGPGGFYRDLVEFDFQRSPPLEGADLASLIRARQIFENVTA